MRALTEREDRRLAKYVSAGRPSDCWNWAGPMSSNGYGMFRLNGRELVAHRVVYQRIHGTVAAELVVDHLCRNPRCVNPAHLEPVTQQVNTLRGVGPAAVNAKKTHCPKGHLLDGENLRIRKNRRECRACTREQLKAQWKRGARKRGGPPSTRA